MKYFGTDGIRGEAFHFITPLLSYRVGRSLYHFKHISNKIIISRDTRESGEMIVENIKKGALEAGLDVCDLGVYATPILAFASIENNCLGIMVTASHNPYHDNGIKIFNKGQKTLPEEEIIIEDVIDNGINLADVKEGKEIEIPGLINRYYELFLDLRIDKLLNIALDLANGATITSAKAMLKKFANVVSIIGDKPDGKNINKDCGSTHLEAIKKVVIEEKLDLGIAFDGDGDRVLVIDDQGDIFDGDLLIYLFAKYMKEHGYLKNNVVVLSKMSNLGIIKALEKLEIKVIQTEVGDKYIFKALKDEEGCLGGENSGHIINYNLLKSGDGVLNAWYLLKILYEYKVRLSDIKKEIHMYPDKMINIKNINKDIAKDKDIVALVKHYQDSLGNNGKVIVRPSGTEPLIRVSVSAADNATVERIINDIVENIKNKGKGE
ncbi:MAG: hypothetical protein WCS32_01200 [Candidatus Izemoplasmatales bacterium]